jgi:hypothetical protein
VEHLRRAQRPTRTAASAARITSDVDAITAINSATSGTAPVDTWSVASVGAALQLANVTQFVERITDVDAEMQRRRRDEEAARQPDGFDGKRRQPATI